MSTLTASSVFHFHDIKFLTCERDQTNFIINPVATDKMQQKYKIV